MQVELSERELKIITKVLQENGKDLRDQSDYYERDDLQADYFEIDVLARKLEKLTMDKDSVKEDEWDLEL